MGRHCRPIIGMTYLRAITALIGTANKILLQRYKFSAN